MSSPVSSHRSAGSSPLQTIPASIVRHLIEVRAYELYEQRCKEADHAKDDWLQAESEILSYFPPRHRQEPVEHLPATRQAMPFHQDLDAHR
jgi:DUF2934 family protein